MENYSYTDHVNPNSQHQKSVQEETKPDCFALDSAFRREFIGAINKGALSRCENLLDSLEDGECKLWLKKRLLEMDFDSILNFMLSA